MAPLSRRLRLVRMVLRWETMAPTLTALLALVAVFLALALFDVLPLLPGWLHAVVLAGFAAAGGFLLRHLFRLPKPGLGAAARRLEHDCATSHRPLQALDDTLASGEAELWHAHRRRMEAAAASLRPGWPAPVLPARDPYALRFAALLLLVIATAGGRSDAEGRLARAVTPTVEVSGLGPTALEVWITPPAYTGLAPLMLKPGRGSDAPLSVPEHSVIRAVLAGGLGAAALVMDGTVIPFERDASGGQRVETGLDDGHRLTIRQGWFTVASWPLAVVRDALPSIALIGQPEGDERGRLAIEAEVSDDYGVVRAWVDASPLEIEPTAPPLRLDLAVPADRPRAARATGRHDLADDDLAGQPARLVPHVEDAAGQVGTGEAVIVTLPERVFQKPVARALIDWRRQISEAPRLGPEVAERLRQVEGDPDLYGGDERVALALALARRDLMGERFDRAEVRDLLWNAAVRIEDGGLGAAEQQLDQARRELEKALTEGATPDQLARLINRFEAAMARWLDALGQRGVEPGSPADGTTVDENELAAMLDTLRGLAEAGDRDGLRRRLEELSRLLSDLGQAHPGGGDTTAAKAMTALRDLARRQQTLLDDSFRRTPPRDGRERQPFGGDDESSPPRPARPSAADRTEGHRAAQAQRALLDALRRLGKDLPEPPPSLGDAADAMDDAAGRLGEGDWPLAAERQGDALRLLRDGAGELLERMAAARGKSGGMVGRDPFGRMLQGTAHGDDGSTRVPGQSDIRRARQILDELRRRAGDPRRSEPELDYLRRLLKQF